MPRKKRYKDVLKSPVRREILILLRNGEMSIGELARALGLAAGTVYYHLSLLEGLVARDEESKKFYLTDEGLTVASEIILGERFPKGIYILFSNRLLSFSLAIISIVLGSIGCNFIKLKLFGFIYTTLGDWFYFPLNLTVIYIGLELLSSIFSGSKILDLNLFLGVCISFLPLAFFPFLRIVLGEFAKWILPFLIIASASLLILIFSLTRGVKIEHSILIVNAILYFNLLIVFLPSML